MKTFTESEIAEFVILTIQVRGGQPDNIFISSQGMEHGYVAVYTLVGAECYAIQYGNNGEVHYALSDNSDNLSDWIKL